MTVNEDAFNSNAFLEGEAEFLDDLTTVEAYLI